jgi:quinol monooxygenase YgiN
MFASIRRYRLEAGSMDELMQLIDTGFAERVQQMDGFIEYQVLECGNGQIITISTFRDRKSAEQSVMMAAEWIRDTLGDRIRLERLDAFNAEVPISRARAEVLQPARY